VETFNTHAAQIFGFVFAVIPRFIDEGNDDSVDRERAMERAEREEREKEKGQ